MLIKQSKMEENVESITMEKEGRIREQSSLRRRKNGAFVRPNLIDVVGQPKHIISTAQSEEMEISIKSDEENNIVIDKGKSELVEEQISRISINDKLLNSEIDLDFGELQSRNSNEKLIDEHSKEMENLENLIRGLMLKEFEVNSEEKIDKITEQSSCEMKKFPEPRKKRSQSEKHIKIGTVIERSDDDKDHVMIELPRKHTCSLKEKSNGTQRKTSLSRSCSLPETKKSKSKLPGFMNFVRGRQSSVQNQTCTSDGEGSGQSMISFESSSSSSHGRRSRSGSILSRSHKCSSPMPDKRSRTGSLITNRTGCPQYFIPGANRGRIFMEPLDLFETQTVCIKGISFRILRDMPRTHRAMSMVGCMGFLVPAPSKYFER